MQVKDLKVTAAEISTPRSGTSRLCTSTSAASTTRRASAPPSIRQLCSHPSSTLWRDGARGPLASVVASNMFAKGTGLGGRTRCRSRRHDYFNIYVGSTSLRLASLHFAVTSLHIALTSLHFRWRRQGMHVSRHNAPKRLRSRVSILVPVLHRHMTFLGIYDDGCCISGRGRRAHRGFQE